MTMLSRGSLDVAEKVLKMSAEQTVPTKELEERINFLRNNLETPFNKAGFDSLDATELALAIEDEFNVEITDDEANNLKNIRELQILVCRKVDNKNLK